MTQSVGHATVPPMTLHAHEDEHRITFNYSIPHVMNLPGGACWRDVEGFFSGVGLRTLCGPRFGSNLSCISYHHHHHTV